MPKPPEADLPEAHAGCGTLDIKRLEGIVRAMDYLGKEAAKTGLDEVAMIVASTFKIIYASYYCILRHDMMNLPATDSRETDEPGADNHGFGC